VRRFTRDQTTLFFDPAGEPIAEIGNGERIVVETADSVCGLAKQAAPRGMHIDEILNRLGGACPVTGPFYVTGARAGDVIEIEIHDIRAVPAEGEAWTAIFAGFGALSHDSYGIQPPLDPTTRLVAYRDGMATLDRAGGRRADIRLHPFLGTVGVAPRSERRLSFSQSPEYLGDVDQPALGAGSTLVVKANVDGGLLALGDAHGAQGDGEITGAAIEIEADADITVRTRPAEDVGFVGLPQLNSHTTIGSIAGLQGVCLADCARAAYRDLLYRMVRTHGFRESDAYLLLGQVGRLRIGNMIDPFYSALASIDRSFLE
jgi:amidase